MGYAHQVYTRHTFFEILESGKFTMQQLPFTSTKLLDLDKN